jgi:hypothetical protein
MMVGAGSTGGTSADAGGGTGTGAAGTCDRVQAAASKHSTSREIFIVTAVERPVAGQPPTIACSFFGATMQYDSTMCSRSASSSTKSSTTPIQPFTPQ